MTTHYPANDEETKTEKAHFDNIKRNKKLDCCHSFAPFFSYEAESYRFVDLNCNQAASLL